MTTSRTRRQPEYRNIGFGDITMKYRMPLAAILSIL
ncbi:succinate dehydrogenase, cytochrome b556 subunit, partial [Burkholderia sp. Bp9012]